MATGGGYELGYEDNRFQIEISDRFHCPICFLVLKDPVMCENEHCYCSSCIKEHLKNAAFCPTCRVHLSVEKLRRASRIVLDYLSELNIHCDFHARGCQETVQVSDLKRHVASCGFSPIQCSNEGCNVLVNKRDRLYHEAQVCRFRKSKCHDCGQLNEEVKEMKSELKDDMKVMKAELLNEMKDMRDEMKDMKDEMKDEVKGVKEEMKIGMKGMKNEIDLMQNTVTSKIRDEVRYEMKEIKEEIRHELKGIKEEVKQELKNEMKGIKEDMENEMKEIVLNAVRSAMADREDLKVEMKDSKQSLQATCSSEASSNMTRTVQENSCCQTGSSKARENIFLAGGYHVESGRIVRGQPTECFNWSNQTWTQMTSAREDRSGSCSFLYKGQMVVAGGHDGVNYTDTIKCLNLTDPAATWEDFALKLCVKCSDHKVVNHNNRLYMSGGLVQGTRSDAVYKMKLAKRHYKMLTRLPQPRSAHGMEIIDNKLLMFAGFDGKHIPTSSVVQYDLIKNQYNEMPPLPYAVAEMATILWQNNVLVLGGLNEAFRPLNSVAMYDVITGRSQMLPSMKRKRHRCTAVLTGNVVVVMGGFDEETSLKSVECFDLEHRVWQDLPDMLEPRCFATAVVKPNN